MGWMFACGSPKQARTQPKGWRTQGGKRSVNSTLAWTLFCASWKNGRKGLTASETGWGSGGDARKQRKKRFIGTALSWRSCDELCSQGTKVSSSFSSASHLPNSRVNGEKSKFPLDSKKDCSSEGSTYIRAHTITYHELAIATRNFRPECLVGEGGFGRVYKGRLESTGQIVAVKQLDMNGLQGKREFLVEVLMLSLLHHPNLVNLLGYCADGDQRL
eukprot:c23661_g2_i1 orf=354-1004(+)